MFDVITFGSATRDIFVEMPREYIKKKNSLFLDADSFLTSAQKLIFRECSLLSAAAGLIRRHLL